MKKIDEMTLQHQFVWTTLQTLEDGQRILGPELQAHTGIKDPRALYQIIKDLRNNGYLVGGSKNGDRGYYECRDDEDLEKTLRSLRNPAFDLLNTANLMEKAYFEQKYGVELSKEDAEEEPEDE